MRHPIWFEREVLADLLVEVQSTAVILGPGSERELELAHGAVVGVRRFDAATMQRSHRLRVIARTGIGVDNIDIEEANRRAIAVCNAPDGPTVSTAEHAVALLLTVAKRIPQSQRLLRDGEPDLYAGHVGVELCGRTLGLVGFGRIARRVAAAARGLGMAVVAFDPYVTGSPNDVDVVSSLDDLLERSDVVSLHLPLTQETEGSFGRDQFDRMRRGAIFLNTSRGALVDHDALESALEHGHLWGAGLDVTDPEPLPPAHPLLHRDDVVVTPHVASATDAGKRRLFETAFRQVIDVLEGRRPDHLVNPEVWERIQQRSETP